MFSIMKEKEIFDEEGRVTVLYQETFIDFSYREVMDHIDICLDCLDLEMCMAPNIGAGKLNGINMYKRYVVVPSTAKCDAIKSQ